VVRHAIGRLPLSRVPIHVHAVEDLPRNPNGKLMRRTLREMAQSITTPDTRAALLASEPTARADQPSAGGPPPIRPPRRV
jgi:hypothetical protein